MLLHVLSGGAAHGLINAVTARFQAETGATIAATYDSVGAVRDKLLARSPADLVIVTANMLSELQRDGHILPDTPAETNATAIGTVHTGIAVRSGDPAPAIATAADLRTALRAADAVYFPDPVKATAGIHFAGVLRRLGLADELQGRLRTFPNGATAMATMAGHRGAAPLGCTQITEIVGTQGVQLTGRLPHEFELATIYAAGIATGAANPDLARRLSALLTADDSGELRANAGFS